MYPFETLVEPLCFLHLPVSSHVKVTQSCLTLCNPIDCIACQAPLSIEFSRQKYWSGAIPFSRESSQHRGWTQVSRIAGGFFTVWATRERPLCTDAQTWSLELALLSMAVQSFLWYISQQTWTTSSLGTLRTSWSLLVHPGVYPGVSTYWLIVEPQSSLQVPSRDWWVIC